MIEDAHNKIRSGDFSACGRARANIATASSLGLPLAQLLLLSRP